MNSLNNLPNYFFSTTRWIWKWHSFSLLGSSLPEIESKIRWAFKKTNGSWMFETPCCRVHVQKIVHVEKRLKYKGETFFFRSIRLKFQQLLWRNNVRHYNSFFEFYCWENMTKPFKCSTFQAHFLLHFIIVLLQNTIDIRIHMCFIAFQSFFKSYLWTFSLLSKNF